MSRARDIANLAGSVEAGGITGPNMVVNGSMKIWQRGVGPISTGGYLVDRFALSLGTVTITQQQSTDVPSGESFNYSWKMTNTGTTSATGAYISFQQQLEAQDIVSSGWDYTNESSYVTLSFWAKSNTAGTYQCGLRTVDGTAYNITSEYTLTANTWKKVTVSYPGNSNLQFDNNSGSGLVIFPMIELGSDYTSGSTDDVWTAHTGSTQTPDKTSSWMSTSSADFYVVGVKLEVGETATPFDHSENYGETLARCQRYYEKSYDYSVVPGTAAAYPNNIGLTVRGMDEETSGQRYFTHTMRVEKRADPTNTFYDDAGNSGKVTTFDSGGTPTNNVSLALVLVQPSMIGCGPSNSAIWGYAYFYESDAEL